MYKRIMILLLAAAMLLPYGCKKKPVDTGTPITSEEFSALTLEWFKEDVSSDPFDLHFALVHPEKLGITELKTSLGELEDETGEEELKERIQKLEGMSLAQLTDDQKLAHASMLAMYRNELDWHELEDSYDFVFTPNRGVNNNLITAFTEFVPRNEEEVVQLIELVKDSKRYFDECIDYTREQFEDGIVQTDSVIDDTLDSLERFISKKEDNEVIRVFNTNLEELNLDKEAEYKAQMKDAVLNYLIPAYEGAISMYKEIRGSGKAKGALSNYGEEGKRYYELIFRDASSSAKSVSEWEKLLKKTVEDLIDEEISFARKNYSAYLTWANDEYSYGMDEAYEIFTALKQNLVADFPAYPEVDYTINYLDPSVASENVAAYYLIAPYDDMGSVNVVKANPAYGKDNPNDYVVTLAHEGYPGHLYQTTYYFTNHPDAAIRYALDFSGYTEGWAMYVEDYAMSYFSENEKIAYLDQLDNRINYYLEAYFDILINYEGYSVDEVAAEMERMGLNASVAEPITNTLLGDPGMFAPYAIGLYEMTRLRDMAKKKLGSSFDPIEYHKVILDTGATTFEILEEEINKYLKAKK